VAAWHKRCKLQRLSGRNLNNSWAQSLHMYLAQSTQKLSQSTTIRLSFIETLRLTRNFQCNCNVTFVTKLELCYFRQGRCLPKTVTGSDEIWRSATCPAFCLATNGAMLQAYLSPTKATLVKLHAASPSKNVSSEGSGVQPPGAHDSETGCC
jgi:hypothetical protein